MMLKPTVAPSGGATALRQITVKNCFYSEWTKISVSFMIDFTLKGDIG